MKKLVLTYLFFSRTNITSGFLTSSNRYVIGTTVQYLSSTSFRISEMPRGVKKEHLPSKVCVVCQRPFTWRKKWENCWDEVTTCSKSCNRKRRALQQESNHQSRLKLEKDNIITENALEEETIELGSIMELSMVSVDENLVNDLENEVGKIDDHVSSSDSSIVNNVDYIRLQRKQAKKLTKERRRAQREGRGDPSAGQKLCDVCTVSVDLLIRCTIDQSAEWKMVCGKCWHTVSGGVVDGDDAHPYYKYGGLVGYYLRGYFSSQIW